MMAVNRSFLHGCSLLIFLFLTADVYSQDRLGKPKITNYYYQDYGSGPVNWWIEEDDRGIIYFANGQGILEYDGSNWSLISAPNYQSGRSMAFHDDGRMYVGYIGDLGYLAPDSKGKMEFVSLRDKIPEEYRAFKDVWETDSWNGKVYFRTINEMYVWDGEAFEVIVTEDAMHVGKILNDKFYVRLWNKGLCLFDGKSFELVPGGEMFADKRIYTIMNYDEDRLILGTRSDGFYLYDGSEFTRFETEIDDIVDDALYLPGLDMGDGRFIFNTFSNGAYMIDKEGRLLQSYNKENGLQDNSIDYIYRDSHGILWFALFNGIASLNLNSTFSVFDESRGLSTSVVFDMVEHEGVKYIGTNNGFYYLDNETNNFVFIDGTFGQGTDFQLHNDRLYGASNGMGLIEFVDKKFRYVRRNINYDFRASNILICKKDPNRMYVSHQDGLSSLYFDSRRSTYVDESFTAKTIPDYLGMQQDDAGRLWLTGTIEGSVAMIDPIPVDGKVDLDKAEFVEYNHEDGLPESEAIFFWEVEGEIHYIGYNDIYTFDESSNSFVKTEVEYGEHLDGTALNFSFPIMDHMGRTWLNAGTGVMIKDPSNDQGYSNESFKEINNIQTWNVYVEPTSDEESTIAWLLGPDGIVRYEGDLERPQLQEFDAMIREITVGMDSIIYAGAGDMPNDLRIIFENNTLGFQYSSPFFISEGETEFSTKLSGLNDEFSEWTKQNTREYINLPHGDYTFNVKARNLYNEESSEAVFAFTISPPWYATWWAYVLYILGAAGLVYAIVKNRTRMLRERQKELEEKVTERTHEVNQRVEELATVNKVTQALTEQLEFDELINMVGDQMIQLFDANICYVAIHDPKTNIINFPYQRGDNMAPLKFGEGFTTQIIVSGEPMLINRDISKEYSDRGLKRVGKQAASYLGVPIPVEDKIIGVVSVQSTETENRFDDNDKRLLNTIARNIGIAIHNAELFEEAKEARAHAEEANETKSAFLSTVSHELRTPLTSVLGFAKIIKKRLEERIFPVIESADTKVNKAMNQVSENLNVVVSEGERLTKLINDVLDLAKIESGKVDWNIQPIFLQDVINRAIASTTSLFEGKSLKLKSQIAPDLPIVNGDMDRMIQVMVNLLSNAVKFTDKGTVEIRASLINGHIQVEVEDSGIGIAPEDQEKVFERFRQAGDTLTDKPQGTGLGLPICKEIIEYHGGDLSLKSQLGKGSIFTFFIPILGERGVVKSIQLDKVVESLKKQIAHVSKPSNGKDRTILVVDDDTPIRSLLSQELTEAGYKVNEASNGKAALDMVRASRPDLILLDVMMPEMNGFDVAAVLKNDPETMDIPIIILSIVQDEERGFNIGVDRYLTKPIDTEMLFKEVGSLLEQGVSKKKVMVVDEDGSTLKTLTDVLKKRGYSVVESNGENLLEKARSVQPDIIMLNSVQNGGKDMVKSLKFEKGMEHVLFFMYQ